MRSLFVGLMSLALCKAATAQNDFSAQIAWYGVYTTTKSQEIDEPTSPTGKRYVSTRPYHRHPTRIWYPAKKAYTLDYLTRFPDKLRPM